MGNLLTNLVDEHGNPVAVEVYDVDGDIVLLYKVGADSTTVYIERGPSGRTDKDLLGWAVMQAGAPRSTTLEIETRRRYAHVMRLFGLGSTSAYALCRRFGHDPEEVI